MSKIFLFLKHNIVVIIIAACVVFLLPAAFYAKAESYQRAIITAIGIDKIENNLEISALVLTPAGNMGSAPYQLIAGNGETVAQAIQDIVYRLGKEIGLDHCQVVVLTNEVLKTDVTKYLDYFIRNNTLTVNASITCTDKSAKEVLKTSINNQKNFNLNLKDIVNLNNKLLTVDVMNVDMFYTHYFTPNAISKIAMITTENVSGASSKSEAGSEGTETSGGEQQQNGGANSGNEREEETKIVANKQTVAVLKKGIKVDEITGDKLIITDILNKKSEGVLNIKNVTDENFKDATISLHYFKKDFNKSAKFINGIPTLKQSVTLYVQIDEVIQNGYSISDIKSNRNYLTKTLTLKAKQYLHDLFNDSLHDLNEKNYDGFGVYREFYKRKNKHWKEFLNTLQNPNDYLKHIQYEFTIDFIERL